MSLYIDHIDAGEDAIMFRFHERFNGQSGSGQRSYDVTVRQQKSGPDLITVTNLNAGHGTTRSVPEGGPPQLQGGPFAGPYDHGEDRGPA